MAEADSGEKTTGSKPVNNRLGWRSRCREMQGVNRRRKVDRDNPTRERVSYSDETASSPEFERYYTDQAICPKGEWDDFMASTRRSLPISFRINTCIPLWRRTIQALDSFSSRHPELSLGHALDYKRLCGTSANLFYHLGSDKSSLRKSEDLVSFRRWLIDEDNRGSLSRQETVSMLPVLYLDPLPHENILDICAAPGMKFLQILDAVHSSLHYDCKLSPCSNRGVIIGNDVCQQRLSTLVHNVKGINCPSAAVTNFDASRFPNLYNSNGEQLLFDRVLADVPCSCDGTMRKAPELWKTWKPVGGLHMHRLQLSIVKRAMQLLKPGGTLIYSTCSLNPLENEAIASYIASEGMFEFGVELVPLDPIPGFRADHGLASWLVPNPDGGYFQSYDTVPESMRHRVMPSMFPSPQWDSVMSSRVMRVLPHHNDTGGFFLLKARKVVSNKEPIREPRPIVESHPEPKWVSKKRGEKLLHEYVLYNELEPELFNTLCDFYGIGGDQRELLSRMLVTKRHNRNQCFLMGEVDSAALYQRCKGGKVEHNDSPGDESAIAKESMSKRCRFAMVGIRAFAKQESKATSGSRCMMRIAQEGTLALLQFLGRRVIYANTSFCAELVKGNMRSEMLLDQERSGNISSLDPLRANGTLESGGCIVVIVPTWGCTAIGNLKIALDHSERTVSVDSSLVTDLMDTIAVSCVISDKGDLFAYVSPYIMQLLRAIAAEIVE
ncbi:NOL1/NOP2/sun family protein family protein [Babesia bovis T2Bo]|uniref:NOL1/NOP2/sun family protein family protein n=1 Tax=Babesia bovis T2Bo TaxID=484906 RepID=UPI001D5F41F7|nr:NOL1/NOP2/sun family protein family protein [Babesia bovis T2Bo]EDO05656.2 NOL1/NOP2/sun family protein family protein [Babesia bovis T2Bo]